MIQSTRVKPYNSVPFSTGDFVLYWMQQSIRTRYNHALEFAIDAANDLGLPLYVVFGLTDGYPEANARHYTFLLQGLKDVQDNLAKRGIPFAVLLGSPDEVAIKCSSNAKLVVMDCGYTHIQRTWRRNVARQLTKPLFQVESDVIVPVDVASTKDEWAAATLRPKIHKHLETYLVPLPETRLEYHGILPWKNGIDLTNIPATVSTLKVDHSVPATTHYYGGENEAKRRLTHFLSEKLVDYAALRSDPGEDKASHLSPYLHFGNISALEVCMSAMQILPELAGNSFVEELVVRRELAFNFVWFNSQYDSYSALPSWAISSLESHKNDPRPHIYSRSELESANTHDVYWNAAQVEMISTGYLHNYMRMYWGKKILEWSSSPEEAYETSLHLNNKYLLDGRDPNSFCGVAWIYGKHDRPWIERPIFGKIRYMNSGGLNRKYNMQRYLDYVSSVSGRSFDSSDSTNLFSL